MTTDRHDHQDFNTIDEAKTGVLSEADIRRLLEMQAPASRRPVSDETWRQWRNHAESYGNEDGSMSLHQYIAAIVAATFTVEVAK